MRRCGVASWCQVALCALSLLAGRAEAQVDPSGRWRTLHTEHFRIHFRPAYRAVAEQEAREAERAYRLLAAELRAPRGVIDLVLGDDVDVANGRSEEHTSELQSRSDIVCRLLLEKKKR